MSEIDLVPCRVPCNGCTICCADPDLIVNVKPDHGADRCAFGLAARAQGRPARADDDGAVAVRGVAPQRMRRFGVDLSTVRRVDNPGGKVWARCEKTVDNYHTGPKTHSSRHKFLTCDPPRWYVESSRHE